MPGLIKRLIECLSVCKIKLRIKSNCCKGCFMCDTDLEEGPTHENTGNHTRFNTNTILVRQNQIGPA